jgi:hypothetical protein
MLVTVLEDNYQMQGINRSIETVIQYIRNPSDKVKELLTRIHETEDKEQRNALKMWLPAFFPSGTFRRGKSLGDLIQHNGIVHLDIDDKKVAKRLKSSVDTKHLVFKFTSPSGGLKLGFKVFPIPDTNEEHRWAWTHLNGLYAGGKADMGSKSWNKQSNLSFDPDAYCNVDCEPFCYPKMPEPTIYSGGPIVVKNMKAAFEMAEDIIKKQGYVFSVGERNNYVYNLCCVLNKFGVEYEVADRLLADRFGKTKFPLSEVNGTLKSVYRRYRGSFGAMKIEQGNRNRKGFEL